MPYIRRLGTWTTSCGSGFFEQNFFFSDETYFLIDFTRRIHKYQFFLTCNWRARLGQNLISSCVVKCHWIRAIMVLLREKFCGYKIFVVTIDENFNSLELYSRCTCQSRYQQVFSFISLKKASIWLLPYKKLLFEKSFYEKQKRMSHTKEAEILETLRGSCWWQDLVENVSNI